VSPGELYAVIGCDKVAEGEVEFGVADEEFDAAAGDLVIAGPDVPRIFKEVVDSHMVIMNAPAGPSEGFIRDIAQFRGGNVPSEEDRQRFIDEHKNHIM
jgi:hypothetical protein